MSDTLSRACLAVVLLSGCYASHQEFARDDDATADVRDAADGGRDDAGADDSASGIWRFVDRDIPDRSIPVGLYFAALPAVAWNGSVAGLVYTGLQPGDDARIAFLPLDARGNPAGDEVILLDEPGIESSFPQIAAEAEGTFLVSVLVDASSGLLVLLRLAADGTILLRSEFAVPDPVFDPHGPPARVLSSVYVAAEGAMEPSSTSLFRFRAPDLSWQDLVVLGDTPSAAEQPVVVSSPVHDSVLVFSLLSDGSVDGRECNGVGLPGCVDLALPAGPAGTVALAAAANSADWYVYVSTYEPVSDGEGGFVNILTLSSRLEPEWDTLFADFYGTFQSGAASDRPAWGAPLVSWLADRWRIHLSASAEPEPGERVHDLLEVSDVEIARRMDDIPVAAIAWTEEGFLVVWDQWRESITGYGIFSSFVELTRE